MHAPSTLPGFQPDPIVAKLPSSVQVYVVGGAVRDALLGRSSSDKDWVVVGATVNDLLQAGFKPVGADFPVFLHPVSQEEYALARTERKSGHGYKGFTFHADPSVNLEDDLARRDFTINAMAMSAQGDLIDPFGGLQDLEKKLMRHVSPAFVEDPLRVLRLARFLARFLDFSVAEETLDLCRTLHESGELKHLVAERIFAELNKGMGEEKPSRMIKLLTQMNAWAELGGECALIFSLLEDTHHKTIDTLGSAFDRWVYQLSLLASREPILQLAQAWRIPKDIQQSAIVFVEIEGFLKTAMFDAASFGRLFNRVDLYRRPERLADMHRLYSDVKGDCWQLKLIAAAVDQVQAGQYKVWLSNAIRKAPPGAALAEIAECARQKWVDSIHQATLK